MSLQVSKRLIAKMLNSKCFEQTESGQINTKFDLIRIVQTATHVKIEFLFEGDVVFYEIVDNVPMSAQIIDIKGIYGYIPTNLL